jgi:hypothetical protein
MRCLRSPTPSRSSEPLAAPEIGRKSPVGLASRAFLWPAARAIRHNSRMAWSLAALGVLGVALVALAKVRRRRQAPGGNDAATQRRGDSPQKALAARASRPAGAPEPTPLKSCPVCLSEYPTQNRFCVRDGVELTEGRSSGPPADGATPSIRAFAPKMPTNWCPMASTALRARHALP